MRASNGIVAVDDARLHLRNVSGPRPRPPAVSPPARSSVRRSPQDRVGPRRRRRPSLAAVAVFRRVFSACARPPPRQRGRSHDSFAAAHTHPTRCKSSLTEHTPRGSQRIHGDKGIPAPPRRHESPGILTALPYPLGLRLLSVRSASRRNSRRKKGPQRVASGKRARRGGWGGAAEGRRQVSNDAGPARQVLDHDARPAGPLRESRGPQPTSAAGQGEACWYRRTCHPTAAAGQPDALASRVAVGRGGLSGKQGQGASRGHSLPLASGCPQDTRDTPIPTAPPCLAPQRNLSRHISPAGQQTRRTFHNPTSYASLSRLASLSCKSLHPPPSSHLAQRPPPRLPGLRELGYPLKGHWAGESEATHSSLPSGPPPTLASVCALSNALPCCACAVAAVLLRLRCCGCLVAPALLRLSCCACVVAAVLLRLVAAVLLLLRCCGRLVTTALLRLPCCLRCCGCLVAPALLRPSCCTDCVVATALLRLCCCACVVALVLLRLSCCGCLVAPLSPA